MGGLFYNSHKALMRGTYPTNTVHIYTSKDAWFENRGPQCDIIMFVDDPTGHLLYAMFTYREDTQIYYEAVKHFSHYHPLPEAFCIDDDSPYNYS